MNYVNDELCVFNQSDNYDNGNTMLNIQRGYDNNTALSVWLASVRAIARRHTFHGNRWFVNVNDKFWGDMNVIGSVNAFDRQITLYDVPARLDDKGYGIDCLPWKSVCKKGGKPQSELKPGEDDGSRVDFKAGMDDELQGVMSIALTIAIQPETMVRYNDFNNIGTILGKDKSFEQAWAEFTNDERAIVVYRFIVKLIGNWSKNELNHRRAIREHLTELEQTKHGQEEYESCKKDIIRRCLNVLRRMKYDGKSDAFIMAGWNIVLAIQDDECFNKGFKGYWSTGIARRGNGIRQSTANEIVDYFKAEFVG